VPVCVRVDGSCCDIRYIEPRGDVPISEKVAGLAQAWHPENVVEFLESL
jgi:hypothetical protein